MYIIIIGIIAFILYKIFYYCCIIPIIFISVIGYRFAEFMIKKFTNNHAIGISNKDKNKKVKLHIVK